MSIQDEHYMHLQVLFTVCHFCHKDW